MTKVTRKTMLVSLSLLLCFTPAFLSACQAPQATEMPLPTATVEETVTEEAPTETSVPTDEPQPVETLQDIIFSSTDALVRLVETPGDEYHTAWSPDGNWLIFTYSENGQYAIGTYHMTEGSWQLLNADLEGDLYLDWSPDSTQFVFDAYDENEFSSIYLADFPTDLSAPLVYEKLNINSRSFMASVSPDGDQVLLFTDNQIVIYDLASKSLQPIPNTSDCWHPKFSPDGTRILATAIRDGHQDIYAFDIETGASEKLTDSSMNFDRAQWSPDSMMIVSVAEKDGQTEIWLTNLDLDRSIRLIAFPGDTSSYLSMPDFSPDGDTIVVTYQGDLWLAENISTISWE
jgi:Tol biopolymer transport system component